MSEQTEAAEVEALAESVVADRIARALAEHYGHSWAMMHPAIRDVWRQRCAELVDFLDQTGFSLLPPSDQDRAAARGVEGGA